LARTAIRVEEIADDSVCFGITALNPQTIIATADLPKVDEAGQ
jgi:hypothetical protein